MAAPAKKPMAAAEFLRSAEGSVVFHYGRRDREIAVSFVKSGAVALDLPGLSLALADIFPTTD
jgi:hypothetical protein